jgi:hypothetical protein
MLWAGCDRTIYKSVIRFFDGKVSEQKLAGFSFFLHTQEALATLRNMYWRMLVNLTMLRPP